MTIRALVILVAICFSANAFAKDKLPKVGNKPLVLVKPKEPTGCKLVGTGEVLSESRMRENRQISRIRLSDKTSRLHPRHVVPKPA